MRIGVLAMLHIILVLFFFLGERRVTDKPTIGNVTIMGITLVEATFRTRVRDS